jgi:soluble cytochrome b562
MTTILQAVESALAQMNNAKRDFAEESSRVREGLQDVSLDVKTLQEEFDNKVTAKLDPVAGALRQEIQLLSEKLIKTQQELDKALKRIEKVEGNVTTAQTTAQDGVNRANQAQNAANAAKATVVNLENNIRTGGIIAQKAEMLLGRDNRHWMRWHHVDPANHDVFMLWRVDNTWHPTIRVTAADRLLARDELHWMRHKGVDAQNQDCYGLWRRDGAWFNLIQVAAFGPLP